LPGCRLGEWLWCASRAAGQNFGLLLFSARATAALQARAQAFFRALSRSLLGAGLLLSRTGALTAWHDHTLTPLSPFFYYVSNFWHSSPGREFLAASLAEEHLDPFPRSAAPPLPPPTRSQIRCSPFSHCLCGRMEVTFNSTEELLRAATDARNSRRRLAAYHHLIDVFNVSGTALHV
jgi:hypothetical protein